MVSRPPSPLRQCLAVNSEYRPTEVAEQTLSPVSIRTEVWLGSGYSKDAQPHPAQSISSARSAYRILEYGTSNRARPAPAESGRGPLPQPALADQMRVS